jgi:hypothetical protein
MSLLFQDVTLSTWLAGRYVVSRSVGKLNLCRYDTHMRQFDDPRQFSQIT